ncbi:malonate decarboxylase subunit epsilon [Paraburkholderia sp. GAS41]|uniref:malonate decarboxylase subunit epsilon n=1 Tax=Paraburkholderia sp. GAS41 TaxID=3035134 RepID=UPI003D1B87C8
MFDLVANCQDAEPIFSAAAEVLDQDPRRYVREAAPAELFSNRSGQILCCTQALALQAALGTAWPARTVIAGYSIGELAAWGCAGAVDGPGILRLAQRRAAAMDAAAPSDGGLAAIVGLRRSNLEPILARHELSIAIVNDVDSFVVGGVRAGLDAACQEAATRGAKHIVTLPVAVPSHTPLLREATKQFGAVLRAASPQLRGADRRLLSGIDGNTIYDMETGIDKLARQISTTIDWASCLGSCRSAGAVAALELGPGTALSRMASPLFPDGRARTVDEFRTLAGLKSWLQRAMD